MRFLLFFGILATPTFNQSLSTRVEVILLPLQNGSTGGTHTRIYRNDSLDSHGGTGTGIELPRVLPESTRMARRVTVDHRSVTRGKDNCVPSIQILGGIALMTFLMVSVGISERTHDATCSRKTKAMHDAINRSHCKLSDVPNSSGKNIECISAPDASRACIALLDTDTTCLPSQFYASAEYASTQDGVGSYMARLLPSLKNATQQCKDLLKLSICWSAQPGLLNINRITARYLANVTKLCDDTCVTRPVPLLAVNGQQYTISGFRLCNDNALSYIHV